jgi:uncharacterized protein (DUF433 family)
MSLAVTAEPIPLQTDPEGVVRVGGTRVTLDTVVAAFQAGASPEEIVHDYPALQLSDVYAVLTYYLRHQDSVDRYLQQRRDQATEVRRQNQARYGARGLRERLLARLQR